MSRKITRLRQHVEAVLAAVPATRDSDITLMIEVWRRYYPHFIRRGNSNKEGVWLEDLYELPREDNVKRIRAIIQNEEHKYLPTTLEIAKQRKIEESVWREYIGYPALV